jgi:Fe-S-cluster-containing hydrogenase component 2
MLEFYHSRSGIFLSGKPKVFRVDTNLCSGCQSCVMACSLTKEGAFSLKKSRIQIQMNESKCLNVPTVCEHCLRPPCLTVCPVGAISRDEESGIVRIDEEACNGCGNCLKVCPFKSIAISENKARKCDLCGGDPECVKVCYPYALQYVEKQPATIREKTRMADERLKTLNSLNEE